MRNLPERGGNKGGGSGRELRTEAAAAHDPRRQTAVGLPACIGPGADTGAGAQPRGSNGTGILPQTSHLAARDFEPCSPAALCSALGEATARPAQHPPTYSCGWHGLSGPCSSMIHVCRSSYCTSLQPSGGCCSQSRSSLCRRRGAEVPLTALTAGPACGACEETAAGPD